ncbi:MAG: methyltransferase domain-containing protein [bacterium]|nr:methyltransferase domain-containing protein [bacterium]
MDDSKDATPSGAGSAAGPAAGIRFDWEARYADRTTPWDLGCPHPELERRIATGELAAPGPGARALVPGCGRGYDACALARAGWSVVGLDYVPELEPLLAWKFAGLEARLVLGDALAYSDPEPFELVWDHTFLSAIDPEDHVRYGALVRACLVEDGRFVSLIFPADKPVDFGGPPFGFDADTIQAILGDGFGRTEDGPVRERVTRPRWGERYASFVRVNAT